MTVEKRKHLERLGYKVITKWEHEFQQEMKCNKSLKDLASELDIVERLNPRDSFFGGRTNASKLYYKISDDEKIKYADFTSLYPFVQKTKVHKFIKSSI